MDANEALDILEHESGVAAEAGVVRAAVKRLTADVERISRMYGKAAFELAVFRGLAGSVRVQVTEAFKRIEEEEAARAAGGK